MALRVLEGGGGDDGSRFLFFLSKDLPPLPRIRVTNACELWSGSITPDKQGGKISENNLDSSKEGVCKLWEAFLACRTPTLTVGDSVATLRFQDGGRNVTLDLSQVPPSEAREQLQDLMFGLVERIQALEKRLRQEGSASAAPSPVSSPEKVTFRGQSIFAPETSPAKHKAGAGQASTKKRQPGESLINPGFKSKKTPRGVDFEDP